MATKIDEGSRLEVEDGGRKIEGHQEVQAKEQHIYLSNRVTRMGHGYRIGLKYECGRALFFSMSMAGQWWLVNGILRYSLQINFIKAIMASIHKH
jgi:hypothetical protein